MSRLGIETQTVFGLPPVEHVRLAAELGCAYISTGLGNVPWKLADFPEWSLRDDAGLRRETRAAMRDTGVSISLGEGFAIRPGRQARNMAGDLDLMAELGAPRVSTVGIDTDLPRVLDEIAVLAALAAERNLRLLVEFAPPHAIDGLQQALAAARHAGEGVGVVIDAMHFFRCGNRVEELAGVEQGLIAYCQLCDVPLPDGGTDYMEEACFERLAPGEGELPLAELLAALPADVPVGVEVPNRAACGSPAELRAFTRRAVEAARKLVDPATG